MIITTKTCTRIHIFKCIYLDGENDSDDAIKTKNAQFFMIFPNISFFHMIVTDWTGPLKKEVQKFVQNCRKPLILTNFYEKRYNFLVAAS